MWFNLFVEMFSRGKMSTFELYILNAILVKNFEFWKYSHSVIHVIEVLEKCLIVSIFKDVVWNVEYNFLSLTC